MPQIRYDDFDRPRLRSYVQRLTTVCRSIEAVVQQMEIEKIKVLPSYNADILDLGTRRVENFANAVTRSLAEFMADPKKKLANQINAERESEKIDRVARKDTSRQRSRG
jgi:hypothetical protein